MDKVLVVNPGSSTIKWTIFNKEDLNQEIASGVAERIGVDGTLITKFNGQKFEKQIPMPTHKEAAAAIIAAWKENNVVENIEEVKNVGFRTIHGGSEFTKSDVIDEKMIAGIEKRAVFAPLHNPPSVDTIRAFSAELPHAKKTGTFDTAFHTTIPTVNSTYPIDKKVAEKYGIKKYGFHGTSHRYVTAKLEEVLGKDKVNFVSMHIGNGASLCAVKDSKSFDTSMGLTPLAGIMMGTRSGDIDPSIHYFLEVNAGMSIKEIDNMLQKHSGIAGVSGISADLRDVESEAEKGNKDAILALDLYAQRIIDTAAAYANKLGGNIDALVFTAGVGENSDVVRAKVINGLPLLGVKLDAEKNAIRPGDVALISTPDSKIPVYVIRTNEEYMIAKDSLEA